MLFPHLSAYLGASRCTYPNELSIEELYESWTKDTTSNCPHHVSPPHENSHGRAAF
jgi:hypothetical protein